MSGCVFTLVANGSSDDALDFIRLCELSPRVERGNFGLSVVSRVRDVVDDSVSVANGLAALMSSRCMSFGVFSKSV